jgi:hypothetical protein
MDCPDCSRTLNSDHALMQHYLGKHGKHLCTECFKTFWSKTSLEQHVNSKHGTTKTWSRHSHSHDDPYPGIAGYWEPRNTYEGNKSFGWFECNHCAKTWFSAHAHKRFKQGCQVCEEQSFPCCMWVNTGCNDKDSLNDEKDDGPHDRARCEACRKGHCMDARYSYR